MDLQPESLARAALACDAEMAQSRARNARWYASRKERKKALRGPRCAATCKAWEDSLSEATGLPYRTARRLRAAARKEAAETGVSRLALLSQRGLLSPYEAMRVRRKAAELEG